MRASKVTLVLSVVAAAAVCGVTTPASAQDPVCAEITVSADQQPPPDSPTFPAVQILDLQLGVTLIGATGDHLLELELYTPRGHRYQVLTAPVSTGSGKTRGPATRLVPDYPFPLPVQYLDPAGEDKRQSGVSLSLPVAGTSIITGSLFGRWQVVPRVDGQPADCGQLFFFTLQAPTGPPIFADGFESGDSSAWSNG